MRAVLSVAAHAIAQPGVLLRARVAVAVAACQINFPSNTPNRSASRRGWIDASPFCRRRAARAISRPRPRCSCPRRCPSISRATSPKNVCSVLTPTANTATTPRWSRGGAGGFVSRPARPGEQSEFSLCKVRDAPVFARHGIV